MASFSAKALNLLRGKIAQGAIGSLGLRLASVASAFAASVLFARLLGTEGLGSYAFAITAVEILLIPAMFGIPVLLGREVPAGLHHHGGSYVRSLGKTALLTVFTLSSLLALVIALLVMTFGHHLEPGMQQPLLIALSMLPILALLWTFEPLSRSVGRVVLAQFPNYLIRPLLILLLVCAPFLLGLAITPDLAVVLTVVASVATLLSAVMIWLRVRPARNASDSSHRMTTRKLLTTSVPFIIIAALSGLHNQADILFLGILSGAHDTGLYRIAHRLASVSNFPHMALMMALGPVVATLFAQNNIDTLRLKVNQALGVSFSGALFICAVLIGFSWFFLGLFGEDFLQASGTLTILGLQQSLGVFVLTIQMVLSLTHHEALVAKNMAFSVLMNVGLNLLLIPHFGTEGAATATLLTTIFFGILLAVEAKKKLGFLPSLAVPGPVKK